MKREIPMLITFLACLVLVLQFILDVSWLDRAATAINDYTSIVATFAMVLGLASLATVHFNRIYRKRENWPYSIILILGFIVSVLFATLYGVEKTYEVGLNAQEFAALKASGDKTIGTRASYFLLVEGIEYEVSKQFYDLHILPDSHKRTVMSYYQDRSNDLFDTLIFQRIYDPLQGTMFSLLAFFMASAAYRAFRAKSLEASLLLLSAFLVMLGRVPIGEKVGELLEFMLAWVPLLSQIDFSSLIGEISSYIMEVPNTAGQRAIMIGAALGMVAASFRIWIGLEKEYLGRD
jgi:hypothetical protein